MKNILLSLLFIWFVMPIFSQNAQPSSDFSASEWVLRHEMDGVRLYYRFTQCNDPENGFIGEYVQFKILNLTNRPKQVEWYAALWYDGQCINCDITIEEYYQSFTIPPSLIIESGCDPKNYPFLNIYSKSLIPVPGEWELTNFEIRNFAVN